MLKEAGIKQDQPYRTDEAGACLVERPDWRAGVSVRKANIEHRGVADFAEE